MVPDAPPVEVITKGKAGAIAGVPAKASPMLTDDAKVTKPLLLILILSTLVIEPSGVVSKPILPGISDAPGVPSTCTRIAAAER